MVFLALAGLYLSVSSRQPLLPLCTANSASPSDIHQHLRLVPFVVAMLSDCQAHVLCALFILSPFLVSFLPLCSTQELLARSQPRGVRCSKALYLHILCLHFYSPESKLRWLRAYSMIFFLFFLFFLLLLLLLLLWYKYVSMLTG